MRMMLVNQLKAVTNDTHNWVTNFANAAALLMQTQRQVDWAGFYLYRKLTHNLILGPYQGKLACNLIPVGKGVCGSVCQTQKPLIVPDVNQFKGHIACDSASRSEVVVPILKGHRLIGVLDLDSNQFKAFSRNDLEILKKMVSILVENSKF